MRLFLDDVRDPPNDDWELFRSPIEFLVFVEENWGKFEMISLDHDLGYICPDQGKEITGYDVMCDIERIAHEKNDLPFMIHFHSANPVGVENMTRVYTAMKRFF